MSIYIVLSYHCSVSLLLYTLLCSLYYCYLLGALRLRLSLQPTRSQAPHYTWNIPMEDKGSKPLASFPLPMVKAQLITQLFLMRKYSVGEIDDTTNAYQLFWILQQCPVNLCMAPSMPGHCP